MDQFAGVMACIFGISIFLIFFGFLAFWRYMRYREVMLLVEKGLVAMPERKNGKDTLRWGIVIAAIGLALIVGLAPAVVRSFHTWPFLLVGLLPTFFGLGLVLIYILTHERAPKTDEKSREIEETK